MISSSLSENMDLLLSKEWDEDQRELLARVIKNIKDYYRFTPRCVKDDINAIINLAIQLKKELQDLKK